MADNFDFTPGSGKTGAADDIGSVLYPRVKVTLGADGAADMDVDSGQQTMANSVPVAIASNQSDVPITLDGEAVVLGAGTAGIGKLTANSGVDIGDVDVTSSALPTGAATSAKQDADNALLTTIDADTSAIATDVAAIEVLNTTIAGDTTSIDGKITACNTGDVTIGAAIPAGANLIGNVKVSDGTETANVNASNELQVRDDDANTDLDTIAGDTTSIDGKITACNTGDVTVGAALPAGTNAIGKLAANSGVDIGDVDILSIAAGDNNIGNVDVASITNASINGPGVPTVDSYTSDDVNLAADTANQSVVAAPGASKQIWVYGLIGTISAAGSISIQDEDDTALSGIMPLAANSGIQINPSGNFAMPWIKVATNKALEIDTVTGAFDGIITNAIVSV